MIFTYLLKKKCLHLFSDFDQLDPHDIKINNKKVKPG